MTPQKKIPKATSKPDINGMQQHYEHAVLPNGLRLVHRHCDGELAHLALMIGSGTRHEAEFSEGIAHLAEHMLFKGTRRRKAHQVVSFLENVGCDLNAYTTKEETCIYASFLKPYYSRTSELFADVVFNSVYPENELEKEKDVVLDEINSYKDNPAEEIFDRFEFEFFKPHPLGRYILGTKESIPGITRESMLHYASQNFSPERMVLVSLGDIAFKHFYNLALKYFGHAQATGHVYSPVQFEGYNLFNLKVAAESHLSHSIIGMPGYSYHHPDKLALIVLNSILGGPALTARLYQSIREKYGLAYSVDSQLAHYSDTGWLAIYMGTDPELSDKAISLCMKEMKKLREQALGTLQLSRAKQQLIVQLAISHESRMHEALSVGKAWLLKNHANSMAEIIGQIEQISPSKLLEVANEVFDTQKMVTLIYQGEQAQ